MTFKLMPNVKFVMVDDTGVLIDLRAGKYYACNHLGMAILEALAASEPLSIIHSAIAAKFHQPETKVVQDVVNFLRDLASKRLGRLDEE
jgi:hypothetical protein